MHLFFYYYRRIFDTVYGVHGIDDDLKQVIHILVIRNDKVDLSVFELEGEALPTIKWHPVLF